MMGLEMNRAVGELSSLAVEKYELLQEFSAATSLLLREGYEAIEENLERRDSLVARLQDVDSRADAVLTELASDERDALTAVWRGNAPAEDSSENIQRLYVSVLAARTQAEILLADEERVQDLAAEVADALRDEMRGSGGDRRALEYYRSLVPEPQAGLSLDENS